MIKTAEKASPVIELFIKEIRSGPLVNIDETPVQVLNEPGRPNTTDSYMWVFRGGDPHRLALVYRYHPTNRYWTKLKTGSMNLQQGRRQGDCLEKRSIILSASGLGLFAILMTAFSGPTTTSPRMRSGRLSWVEKIGCSVAIPMELPPAPLCTA